MPNRDKTGPEGKGPKTGRGKGSCQNSHLFSEVKERMKCDKCGWRIAKKDYDGYGECFACFNGLMLEEIKRKEDDN